MPETVVNKRAPTVPSHYDILSPKSSMEEYYRLKIDDLRTQKAEASGLLSAKEKEALQMTSDLDLLTTKILVKLKVLSDYDPLLNTMRSLTGHEDRQDIARELAVRHYNKSVTDHFVSQFVTTSNTKNLLFAEGGIPTYRGNIASGVNNKSIWGPLGGAVSTATGGAAGNVAEGSA